MPSAFAPPPQLLIVPGLRNSGPAHWQSWLQAQYAGSIRVEQDDWLTPDIDSWSASIHRALRTAGPGPFVAAAHSFGCLALAHALSHPSPTANALEAALLVAPADPRKFSVEDRLPQRALPIRTVMVISQTDPWMSADTALAWAERWGSHGHDLGDAGHINTEAGFGPLPLARRWVTAMQHRRARQQRAARADLREWSFAV